MLYKVRNFLLAFLLLNLLVQTDAFLCDIPILGFIFRLLFPFLCTDDGGGGGGGGGDGDDTPTTTELPQGPTGIFDDMFDFAGCFVKKISLDAHTVTAPSVNERAVECSDSCTTRIFGVADDKCYCFTDFDPPRERLSIGSCASVTDTANERMALYIAKAASVECNKDQTRAVRDGLVLEDRSLFGYDIVTDTFKGEIFELFADECGTNIYEVFSDESSTSGSFLTSSSSIKEFAQSQKDGISSSITTSASAGYSGLLFSASLSASFSASSELNSLLESEGAQSSNSKVFTSLGVRRVAGVEIRAFENRFGFISFNTGFGNLLAAYRNSGYSTEIARNIIDLYGTFVVTRGLYGGFVEYRATVKGSGVSNSFNTESDAEQCYEASVSASGGFRGFSASGGVDTSQCTSTARTSFESAQSQFQEETSQQDEVGGSTVDGVFTTSPGQAVLLKERNKYPPGDNGVEFRLLSDFLDPSKVSPLVVRNFQITEEEFGTIQENLQNEILDYVTLYSDILDNCNCTDTGLSYIVRGSNGPFCKCYEPFTSNLSLLWTGTYSGQARFGGAGGTWGNGGTYPMVVSADGKITVKGEILDNFTFDEEANKLSWIITERVNTEGEVTFHESFTSSYYFADQPGETLNGRSFTGRIRSRGPSGFLDYRGIAS